MCQLKFDLILRHKYIEITSVLRHGQFALESIAPFKGNMEKVTDITFKSLADFRHRIAKLWQDQAEDEEYNFIFTCSKAEKEFDQLVSSFQRYDRE